MKVDKTKGVIHAIFQCDKCKKYWDKHTTAAKLAYAHASKTGHTVKGEIGYGIIYN